MVKFTKQSIPNYLTISRAMLIVPLVAIWVLASAQISFWATFSIFVLGSLSDLLDGYLARKWNVQSEFGATFDQITDKLLVATVLLFLVFNHSVAMLSALALLLREIYVSGLREYLAQQHISVPVSKLGKWKTATQMLGISLILLGVCLQSIHIALAGNILLVIAVLLAFYSAYQYSRPLWKKA